MLKILGYAMMAAPFVLVFDDYTWKSPKGDILDEPSIEAYDGDNRRGRAAGV